MLLLASLAAMGPAAVDIYLPSIPAMASDFGAPAGRAELTVAAFLLGVSSGQFFHGRGLPQSSPLSTGMR